MLQAANSMHIAWSVKLNVTSDADFLPDIDYYNIMH